MSPVTVERPRDGNEVPESTGGGTDEQTPASDESAPSSKPPRDAIFEILRASRRREVLRYLDAHGGEATIGALAEYVAARENDVDRSMVSTSQRKRVYVGLYQMHLPKMDGYGVVAWDKDRGFVRLCESARWPLAYLQFEPERHVESLGADEDGPLATLRRYVSRLGDVLPR